MAPSVSIIFFSVEPASNVLDIGSVQKYNITSGVWTDITPVSGSNLYFGFGGLAVDLQKPGTVMVAALNSWWPDGQIFRSTDGGVTWSPLWYIHDLSEFLFLCLFTYLGLGEATLRSSSTIRTQILWHRGSDPTRMHSPSEPPKSVG